jgi:hypothetical protein
VLEIKPPQQIAIGLEPVGVIDVGGLQETQKVACRRLDNFLQARTREVLVADKVDRLDARLGAFLDLENQIDPVIRQFDDFRIDRNVETTATMVDLDNSLNVGLDGRA